MNVLSLFNGMSCGRIALERAGIAVDRYYSSEVDKYAIKVADANYPEDVKYKLGDVRNIDKVCSIDLLIGGSPCQNFSFAGNRKGLSTRDNMEILSLEHYMELKASGFEFIGQSYLFWEYVRILKDIQLENPDVLFLLENVMMAQKWKDLISKTLGVEPIMINSALVSAQNRKRLYWTNIPSVEQPEDKKIFLEDVVFDDALFVGRVVGRRIDANGVRKDYSSLKPVQRLELRENNKSGTITTVQKDNTVLTKEGFSVCIDAVYTSRNNRIYEKKSPTLRMECGSLDLLLSEKALAYMDREVKDGRTHWDFAHHSDVRDAKSKAVVANFFKGVPYNVLKSWDCIRSFHPVECERLQTVPDHYTDHVSKTQQLKMLGNGWTVDVIAHIFKGIRNS